MVADILTKALAAAKTGEFRTAMGLVHGYIQDNIGDVDEPPSGSVISMRRLSHVRETPAPRQMNTSGILQQPTSDIS